MSRVENLESQAQGLNPDELKSFREWFANFDAEAWGAQIDADAKSCKLQALIERALRDHEAGRSTPP